MSRKMDAGTQAFVAAARERAGVQVVLSDASVFSSLSLIRALQRNEIVAIQLDRSAGAGGVRMLPFLGVPAPFPSGPFVLARLAGSPIVPVFAPRLGGAATTSTSAARCGCRAPPASRACSTA
jgi:lauroyl/myristoyl acyltransferase